MTFAATILTLYPEMFPGSLGLSLAGRALKRGDWSLDAVQIRDFATDKHKNVDDTPAGGGAGGGGAAVVCSFISCSTMARLSAGTLPRASSIMRWLCSSWPWMAAGRLASMRW